MSYNALLAVCEKFYVQVETADGADPDLRKEGFVSLGGVIERAQAEALCRSLLRLHAAPREALVVGGLTYDTGGPTDFVFREGDRMTVPGHSAQRVKSITVSLDGDGAKVTPELANVLEFRDAAVERTLARWASGSMAGSSVTGAARPSGAASKTNRIYEIPPFSADGLVSALVGDDKISPPYTPARPILLTDLVVNLHNAGLGTTVIQMLVGDTGVGLYSMPAGVRLRQFEMAHTLVDPTVSVQFKILSAGAGASGISLQVRANLT